MRRTAGRGQSLAARRPGSRCGNPVRNTGRCLRPVPPYPRGIRCRLAPPPRCALSANDVGHLPEVVLESTVRCCGYRWRSLRRNHAMPPLQWSPAPEDPERLPGPARQQRRGQARIFAAGLQLNPVARNHPTDQVVQPYQRDVARHDDAQGHMHRAELLAGKLPNHASTASGCRALTHASSANRTCSGVNQPFKLTALSTAAARGNHAS